MLEDSPLLLQRFPELVPHCPWVRLLPNVPTPLEYIADTGVWVKRDDLACPHYGGNKARKFEWILGELHAQERRGFFTFGGLCSNHCTAAAIYGAMAGLSVELFFVPTPLLSAEYDELLLQAHLGAEQRLIGTGGLPTTGLGLVPPAGSTVAGVLGYVNAGLELAQQIAQGAMPSPERIYIAAATRGTALGLAMGLVLAELKPLPTVCVVETVTPAWQRARVFLPTPQLALQKLRAHSPAARVLLPARVEALACTTRLGFDREPLGVITPEVRHALEQAEELGLTLDPHFSARAWAALQADRALWEGKPTLFWQTHGRVPEEGVAAARAAGIRLPPALERAAQRSLNA